MINKNLQIASTMALMLVPASLAFAQPGLGALSLRVYDGPEVVQSGEFRVSVLPYTFHHSVPETWMDALRDSIGNHWLRLPSHVHACRLIRGNSIMELWMDSLRMNLEQDIYIDRIGWREGSFDIYAKGRLKPVHNFTLPGTCFKVRGYYLRFLLLKPRSIKSH